jgi:hypothetical protein
MERVDAAGQTRRRDDPYVALRFELPPQVVAHRHEVDEVIGVQVADEDGIDGARFERGRQPGKRPLAEVEDDRRGAGTYQVRGARRSDLIGVRRSSPEDVETHPRGRDGIHGVSVADPGSAFQSCWSSGGP